MENIVDVLESRGFIDAVTSSELREIASKPLKVYAGFDPTSDSLHIGSLIPMMGLAWCQRCGHQPIAIVGGATGMIGDPSGKSSERKLLDEEAIQHNLRGIRKSLEKLLDFHDPVAPAKILNNADWFKGYGFIDFLRNIGKHFRIGPMLAKESVRLRLSTEEGMSFTEFSYPLVQAYDYLYLFDHHDVRLQMGGSDQWGNITAGCELIRKMRNETVYGLTFSLLTRSDGKKFGKTEEGAIWINSDKLSAYDFYQYFFRVADADVIKMMRLLTFMDLAEIKSIEEAMKESNYQPNSAQRRLAEEVTRIIHGEEGVKQAERVTQAAAPGAKTSLDVATLEALASEIPCKTMPKEEVLGVDIVDLFVSAGLQGSKSEARRLIEGGGAYVNNEKVSEENKIIQAIHLIDGRLLLLGLGKKKKVIIRLL